jgi:O-methyltransferase
MSAGAYLGMDNDFLPLKNKCEPFTMTSPDRLYALWQAARYVVRNRIPGDFVECGVWRGGSSMMAALTFLSEGDLFRSLWLFDTYEGMSEPTNKDVELASGRSAVSLLAEQERVPARNVWCIAQFEDVRSNMESTGYPTERIIYRKGRVEQALLGPKPRMISILRLDTDWYESTLVELQQLWPLLVHQGILIIDDYGWWRGAREAVDEFFATLARPPFMSRIDNCGVVAVKV